MFNIRQNKHQKNWQILFSLSWLNLFEAQILFVWFHSFLFTLIHSHFIGVNGRSITHFFLSCRSNTCFFLIFGGWSIIINFFCFFRKKWVFQDVLAQLSGYLPNVGDSDSSFALPIERTTLSLTFFFIWSLKHFFSARCPHFWACTEMSLQTHMCEASAHLNQEGLKKAAHTNTHRHTHIYTHTPIHKHTLTHKHTHSHTHIYTWVKLTSS